MASGTVSAGPSSALAVTATGATATTRGSTSAAPRRDPLTAALASEFDVVTHEVHEFRLDARQRSGASTPEPSLQISIPRSDRPSVLLVEDVESGRFRWVFADAPSTSGQARRGGPAAPNTTTFTVPLEPTGGATRGVASAVAKKVLRVVVPKLADAVLKKAGLHVARWWEDAHRVETLRLFGPSSYRLAPGDQRLGFQEAKTLAAGPALLMLHGTMAQAHTSFRALPEQVVRDLGIRYGGRVFAYDHYTLSRTPGDNAARLVEELGHIARRGMRFEFDVVAHSRGGLVARELAELAATNDLIGVRSITFVATPNSGTPLCSPAHLDSYVSQLTNLLTFVPDNPVVDSLDTVLALVQHLLVGAFDGIAGIRAMDPSDSRLAALNAAGPPDGVVMRAMSSDYEPPEGTRRARRLRDAVIDRIFDKAANDLMVPTDSVVGPKEAPLVTADNWLRLKPGDDVDHGSYWTNERSLSMLLRWLGAAPVLAPPVHGKASGGSSRPASSSARSGLRRDSFPSDEGVDATVAMPAGVPAERAVAPEPLAGDSDAFGGGNGNGERPIKVTLLHASLEHARFPVMVGHYEDAPIRGAEGVLDARLDGALSRRYLVNRYPRRIGESAFLRAAKDEVQYPIGAYVIGLGRTGELTKADLTTAVYRAVLDRCLRIHEEESDRDRPRRIEVGVSSVLVGSSLEAGGLSIDSSVASIVDGVMRANVQLERYEKDVGPGATSGLTVRVQAVEIVERFADRCELASRALTMMDDLIGTDRATAVDADPVPRKGEGHLPARSPAAELSDTWSRFVVTASDRERDRRVRAEANGDALVPPEMELDVSFFGRLARVDRSLHTIDRAAVERLIDRALEMSVDDGQTANTLYELLFPRALKREVAQATELHLVVDEVTANYPWELLAMRTQDGERRALSLAEGLLRQFRESDTWLANPRRPRQTHALVVGNPPVPGYDPLPGAAEEAQTVTGLLARNEYEVTSLIWDANGRFVGMGDAPDDPVTAILDALFAQEYRIIHLATHGEAVSDPARPGSLITSKSGAVIGQDLVISANTVRQLPVMPDLFFLNCCHLAKVGLNRLSAGISRELMAGGVRAMIAAGWPVSDTAAVAFAKSVYESLLEGADYATAVERGRLRARDGSNTWAAYQCYGVPGFRLSTGRRGGEWTPRRPFTYDELVRRIITCSVTAADIGRPDALKVGTSRTQVRTELSVLEAAADLPDQDGAWQTAEVCELLASAYNDLGDLGKAVRWYDRACSLGERNAHRLRSLEQLAVVRYQYAQRLARDDVEDPDGWTAKKVFDDAAANIKTLLAIDETDERRALSASLAKKQASTMEAGTERWRTLVQRAHDNYAKSTKAYQQNNAAQLAAVLGLPRPELPERKEVRRPTLLTDEQDHEDGFWGRARSGDELLTNLMFAKTRRAQHDLAEKLSRAYLRAFTSRSSWRERSIVIDHLRDLIALLPPDDGRAVQLNGAYEKLVEWGRPHDDETPTPAAATAVSSAEASVERGRAPRRSTRSVDLELLPAGHGDSLLLTYGTTRRRSRILIDAGPANAYKRDLRSRFETLGAVDLFVVTHVDADHIDGAIQLLLDAKLDIGEVWFNGWKHLPKSRGMTEGAILDALLDGRSWNAMFDGGTIQVPETGALPSVLLPGGATATLLSPTVKELRSLRGAWQRKLTAAGVTPGSAKEALELLEEVDRFDTARGGAAPRAFGRDSSIPNGSSIAFLFEYEEVALLLGADAYAGVLESSIRRLLAERGEQRLRLDAFKLAHHGSLANISAGLLDLIECERFLVSTDGKVFGHPDVEALDLVVEHASKTAQLLVNYESQLSRTAFDAVKDRMLHEPHLTIPA
jgi:beta-lactamase superfamily II metal-dependent hydrolase